MQHLYKITAKAGTESQNFTRGEIISIAYHDIFDYPLTIGEMVRWRANDNAIPINDFSIESLNSYFFKAGHGGMIFKRTLRSRISERKMTEARKASNLLSLIPSVRMVAVTGSLAMKNSGDESDIDLMVITKKGKLWTTRLMSHLIVRLFGFKVRRPGDKNQKDKLCMNIWMDESDLEWRKNRNLYTAHEIAQIVPVINKGCSYEEFLSENKWILRFWPNSVKIESRVPVKHNSERDFLEKFAYRLQYLHMEKKITREIVNPTRALFHPQDWGKFVLSRLSS